VQHVQPHVQCVAPPSSAPPSLFGRLVGLVAADHQHVVLRQQARDDLHAIGGERGPRAVAPAAELAADIGRAQAKQARDAGLHAAQFPRA